MPATNIGTKWSGGDFVLYDKATGSTIATFKAATLEFEIAAGAKLRRAAGGFIEGSDLLVRNETGGALAAGDLVYVSGWSETQSRFLVTKAAADAAGARAILVMRGALANNTNGVAYKTYRLTAVNTGGSVVGNPIYLSTTAGGWTLTAPTAANSIQQIVGRVAVVNAATGEIEFNLDANNQPKIGTNEVQANSLDGVQAANVADVNVIGGIPVLHRIDVADGVTGNIDTVLTHKTRVVDAWIVKTVAAGGAGDTITVSNGATAITDAMSINVAAKAVVRAGTIDAAQHEVAAAGTLRVVRTKASANNVACTVYVLGIRVA